MKLSSSNYRPALHFFVCTNDRPDGAALPCCAKAGGVDVAEQLRLLVQRAGLLGKVWVTPSGCLTFCNKEGATVAAYPAGNFYTGVKMSETSELFNREIAALKDRVRE